MGHSSLATVAHDGNGNLATLASPPIIEHLSRWLELYSPAGHPVPQEFPGDNLARESDSGVALESFRSSDR